LKFSVADSQRTRKNSRMKTLFTLLLTSTLAICSFAQEKTNAPAVTSTNKMIATLPASAATEVKAPFTVANGILSQPEQTELEGGGRAVFSFTIAEAGTYIVKGTVDAPGDDANSFFVNVDAPPTDDAIWDIEATEGFQERTVSWRGTGDASSDEFNPKTFKLAAGEHKLNIWGREPAQLKNISIYRAK
jgi:hypothetical protein